MSREALEALLFASDLSLRAQRGELPEPAFWQAVGERLGSPIRRLSIGCASVFFAGTA
jgi:hypothetical protein